MRNGEERVNVVIEGYKNLHYRYVVDKMSSSYFVYVYGRGKGLKLYGSSQNMYPDKNDYQWVSDVGNYKSVSSMFSSSPIPDLNAFVLDSKNQIVHLPYLKLTDEDEQDKESVALQITDETWKYSAKYCYISCTNTLSTPITITLITKRKQFIIM